MDASAIATARYHLLETQIMFSVGYAIIVYDWLCCLFREYKLIWRMKFSSVKVLYLFCRYWPMFTIPYVLYAYTRQHSWDTCLHIFRIPVALATWNQLAAECVLLARTTAFLGNRQWITLSLSAALLAITGFQLWVVFGPMILVPFIPDDSTGPCLPTSPGAQIMSFFFVSWGFDSLVTGLMVYRLFQLKAVSGEWSRSPLMQLFISEGLWYFFIASGANIVNGIFFLQKAETMSAMMVMFSNMIPCILACRLILDLREHAATGDTSWVTTRRAAAGFVVPNIFHRSKRHDTHGRVSTIVFRRQAAPQQHGESSIDQLSSVELSGGSQLGTKSMAVIPEEHSEMDFKDVDLEQGSQGSDVKITELEHDLKLPMARGTAMNDAASEGSKYSQ